jgi:hypothetical protein
MLNVTGEAFVTKRFKKTTNNGHQICDLQLRFNTSVVIDKASKEYRQDTVAAFIIGEHQDLPNTYQRIKIIESQLRVNEWVDKNTNLLRSKPEILISKWEIL